MQSIYKKNEQNNTRSMRRSINHDDSNTNPAPNQTQLDPQDQLNNESLLWLSTPQTSHLFIGSILTKLMFFDIVRNCLA